jgi:adenylate cyclase
MRKILRLLRRLYFFAPLLAVALVCGLMLADPPLVRTLRHALWDQYQRLEPRIYQDTAVRVVDIDEESLARIGQWPWPRYRIAELVDRLQQLQVAAVGFDVVFAEADRTSPAAVSRDWPLSAGVRQQIAGLPDNDAVLAEQLKVSNVVLGFSLERKGPGTVPPTMPVLAPVVMGDPPQPYVHRFGSVVPPLPVLSASAPAAGALTFVPDNDGVVRRVPLVLRVGDQLVPTLVTELLRIGQGADNYLIRMGPASNPGIAEIRVGQVVLPTTRTGEAWVHYATERQQRLIPAWKVLAGEVTPDDVAGRLVLVGSSAQGLMDLRFSPLGGVVPGVEAHAQILEQALTDSFLYRPNWAVAVEAITLVVAGMGIGLLALYSGALLSAVVTATALGATVWGGWYAFSAQHLLIDSIVPAIGIFAAFLLGSMVHHFTSERRQRWVRQAFSRYVSPNLVNHIVNNPDSLELGGRRLTCSFVFTDLAGFTGLMEKIDPGEAVALLNRYLDEMIHIAFAHEGTLDRIVGDAVAIMFSAPVHQPDHQKRAFDCALAMQRYATQYALDLQARGIPFGHTRIGVHCGEVIVGNFGGSTIFDYRALGDPVNTAARLESVNKHLGTRVCVSEDVLSGVPGAQARRVGRLTLKGKTRALLVWQPLNDGLGHEVSEAAAMPAYEHAYDLMAQGDPDALDAFEHLASERPNDPLVRLHLRRLRQGESGEVIVMNEK